ncbi:MAG: YeeE/YedE family protein [Clostridia bacterium]|nr:YeeE/YedE family protein [Clostridia bacterium]
MRALLIPGILGLLLGLTLRWTRLCSPVELRRALAFRVCHATRSLLEAVGAGMALTALLMWLAVIDVDGVVVLPLSAGALAGGAVFGVAVALAGFTPLTAFAGVSGRHGASALCTLAGCLAGTLLLPLLDGPLAALRSLPPHSATTLFRVTLDEPYLLGGGFLGQGCAGLLLMAIAACIPSNRAAAPEAPDESAPEMPPEPPALPPTEPLLCLPAPAADAPEETFVALLPGEEPLVVDTATDESPAEEAGAEDPPDAGEPPQDADPSSPTDPPDEA